MADVQVTTVNNSGQTAIVICDEESDFLANVKKRVTREELASCDVKAYKPKAATPAAKS